MSNWLEWGRNKAPKKTSAEAATEFVRTAEQEAMLEVYTTMWQTREKAVKNAEQVMDTIDLFAGLLPMPDHIEPNHPLTEADIENLDKVTSLFAKLAQHKREYTVGSNDLTPYQDFDEKDHNAEHERIDDIVEIEDKVRNIMGEKSTEYGALQAAHNKIIDRLNAVTKRASTVQATYRLGAIG